MRWIEKQMAPFLMGTTSSISMQRLGRIAHCAPAVGAKCGVCFCHAPIPEHRAFEGQGCIVRTGIAMPFTARFRRGFQLFFTRDCSFRCTTQFAYSLLVGATIFAKLRLKIAKRPKIGGKVCAHHFDRQLIVLKKFHRSCLGRKMQMCTYIKFCRMSLPSADSKCRSSYRQSNKKLS